MEPEEELNSTPKRFLELETVGIGAHNQEEIELTHHEKIAQKKLEQSLTYNGERYEVALPWKHERPNLSNNRQMAETRLELV